MRNIFGVIFMVLGGIMIVIVSLWGLISGLTILSHVAGFWGVVIGFISFPITIFVTPWYALIAGGAWFPLVVVYGGGILATTLFGIGLTIKGVFAESGI